jgi:hypothetical protein
LNIEIENLKSDSVGRLPSLWQMGPISFKASKEQQDVVPRVADTKNGTKPDARSSSIALANGTPRNVKFSSVSSIRSLTNPIIAAFSTHEWALCVRKTII